MLRRRDSPAYLELFMPTRSLCLALKVQLRACGERTCNAVARFEDRGSAPRVLRTQEFGLNLKADRRFSPAGAGNATGR